MAPILCTGDYPYMPEVLMYYVAHRDLLYVKDYAGGNWIIKTYDLAGGAWNAATHVWPDEKYMVA